MHSRNRRLVPPVMSTMLPPHIDSDAADGLSTQLHAPCPSDKAEDRNESPETFKGMVQVFIYSRVFKVGCKYVIV